MNTFILVILLLALGTLAFVIHRRAGGHVGRVVARGAGVATLLPTRPRSDADDVISKTTECLAAKTQLGFSGKFTMTRQFIWIQSPHATCQLLENTQEMNALTLAITERLPEAVRRHHRRNIPTERLELEGLYTIQGIRTGSTVEVRLSESALADPFGGPPAAQRTGGVPIWKTGTDQASAHAPRHTPAPRTIPVADDGAFVECVLHTVGDEPKIVTVPIGVPLTCGRALDADVVLPFLAGMSEHHLEVTFERHGAEVVAWVTDLSTYGTFREGGRMPAGERMRVALPTRLELEKSGLATLDLRLAGSFIP